MLTTTSTSLQNDNQRSFLSPKASSRLAASSMGNLTMPIITTIKDFKAETKNLFPKQIKFFLRAGSIQKEPHMVTIMSQTQFKGASRFVTSLR